MRETHLLPAGWTPAPAVLHEQMARPHLCWAIAPTEMLACTREVHDLFLCEFRWAIPERLLRLRVVEIRHAARGRDTDFPRRL